MSLCRCLLSLCFSRAEPGQIGEMDVYDDAAVARLRVWKAVSDSAPMKHLADGFQPEEDHRPRDLFVKLLGPPTCTLR